MKCICCISALKVNKLHLSNIMTYFSGCIAGERPEKTLHGNSRWQQHVWKSNLGLAPTDGHLLGVDPLSPQLLHHYFDSVYLNVKSVVVTV